MDSAVTQHEWPCRRLGCGHSCVPAAGAVCPFAKTRLGAFPSTGENASQDAPCGQAPRRCCLGGSCARNSYSTEASSDGAEKRTPG